jgi:hypothetical protein
MVQRQPAAVINKSFGLRMGCGCQINDIDDWELQLPGSVFINTSAH